jgi:hypothetical protein
MDGTCVKIFLRRSVFVFVLSVAGFACSNSSPSSPSGSSSVPTPAQPAANASLRFGDQPVTLVVQNAAVTTTSAVTYTFEVASDAGFASKVQIKDGVPQGANGQTSVKLDPLAGGRDYYWHARVNTGGSAGQFSAAVKFTVGGTVVLSAPAPIGPLTNATTTPRPALRVTNATRTGQTGPITYLFEVSSSPAFSTIVVSATQPEGINETGYIPPTELPNGATLFWRATAIDAADAVSSAPSPVQTFTTRPYSQAERIALQLGVPLWTGAEPGGSIGHATMGDDPQFGAGWQVQTLYYAPANVMFKSPDIEQLRYFELFDRGYDPDSAIAWMVSNGYPTIAQWYPPPEKAVIGFQYVYIAARGKVVTNATWDVVVRVE